MQVRGGNPGGDQGIALQVEHLGAISIKSSAP